MATRCKKMTIVASQGGKRIITLKWAQYKGDGNGYLNLTPLEVYLNNFLYKNDKTINVLFVNKNGDKMVVNYSKKMNENSLFIPFSWANR